MENYAGATGTNNPTSVIVKTNTPFAWVVDAVVSDDTAITVGAGQTQRQNVSCVLGSGGGSDSGQIVNPDNKTMSWTDVGASNTWAMSAIALKPKFIYPPMATILSIFGSKESKRKKSKPCKGCKKRKKK